MVTAIPWRVYGCAKEWHCQNEVNLLNTWTVVCYSFFSTSEWKKKQQHRTEPNPTCLLIDLPKSSKTLRTLWLWCLKDVKLRKWHCNRRKGRRKKTYTESWELWKDGKMPLKIITDIQTFIAILSHSKNYHCGWQKYNEISACLPIYKHRMQMLAYVLGRNGMNNNINVKRYK